MKAIGVLGGTFDPPHNAHYEIAKRAIEQYKLDKVIFIPTGSPWQKGITTSFEARYKMTSLLIEENELFELNNIEKSENSPSYTVDTLKKLKIDRDSSYFILGSDVAIDIKSWKDYEEINNLTKFLIAPRNEINNDELGIKFPFDFQLIEGEELDISSTGIRNKIINDKTIEDFVPKKIINYIKENNLY